MAKGFEWLRCSSKPGFWAVHYALLKFNFTISAARLQHWPVCSWKMNTAFSVYLHWPSPALPFLIVSSCLQWTYCKSISEGLFPAPLFHTPQYLSVKDSLQFSFLVRVYLSVFISLLLLRKANRIQILKIKRLNLKEVLQLNLDALRLMN